MSRYQHDIKVITGKHKSLSQFVVELFCRWAASALSLLVSAPWQPRSAISAARELPSADSEFFRSQRAKPLDIYFFISWVFFNETELKTKTKEIWKKTTSAAEEKDVPSWCVASFSRSWESQSRKAGPRDGIIDDLRWRFRLRARGICLGSTWVDPQAGNVL